jgi:preprotein translocase subunit YajC
MEPGFLVPIAFFAMVFGIVYLAIRKKERTLMIQKGADASLFQNKRSEISNLNWGLLFLGIGVGILLGRVFAAYTCLGEEASYFSLICLFGGISLVVYHFLARRLEKQERQDLPPKE